MRRAFKRWLLAILGATAVLVVAEVIYRARLRSSSTATDAVHFEIYGVGESTLLGQPFDPKISVPQIIDHMFGHQVGGRVIAVRNLAERGVPILPQAVGFERAVASRDANRPGVALIVSGHNEKLAPGDPRAGESSRLGDVTEQSAIVQDAVLALQRRRILGREKSLAAWEANLRRVIEAARGKGLLPILGTMASNISRIEPNVDGSEGPPIAAIMEQGARLEEQGEYAPARDLYVAGIEHNRHRPALLHYRAGRCMEALGDFAAAREEYWKAVDVDPQTMFGRATRLQHELVRRLAREYDVPLVDAVEIFERHSPNGILGDRLFMDGQHPSLEGYLLLANAYAQIIAQRFGTTIVNRLRDGQEMAAALGFGPRDFPDAMIDSGSWLIATAVGHPFPRDRMALATERFASVVGKGDDFSGWMGIALAQAAVRGGMLRHPEELPATLGYSKSYRILRPDLPLLLRQFQKYGVDDDVIQRLSKLADK